MAMAQINIPDGSINHNKESELLLLKEKKYR